MSDACSCQIQSDPDIDGIGIRVSLYAQAAITLVIYAISPDNTTFDSWWSTLVTALSLQLAALASASTITLYHAVLVTWLSFPALIMSFSFFGLFYVEGDAPSILLILTYVHTCSFLSFTLWVWAMAPTFCCADMVHLVVFGQHVRVTGWIRYIVLILLGLWALGVAIASILGVLYYLARQPAINRLSARIRAFEAHYLVPRKAPEDATTRNERVLGGAFTSFAFLVFSLIMAELMVASHDVVTDSGPWGFGQVVALILLLTPVFTVIRVIRDDYLRKNTKPLDQRPLASLWRHIRRQEPQETLDFEKTERAHDSMLSDSSRGSYELISLGSIPNGGQEAPLSRGQAFRPLLQGAALINAFYSSSTLALDYEDVEEVLVSVHSDNLFLLSHSLPSMQRSIRSAEAFRHGITHIDCNVRPPGSPRLRLGPVF